MGNGMNKVLSGLYIGNYRDSKDYQQLQKYQITHIVAIHDSPRRLMPDKHYLCVMASDTPDQNLSQYFSVCNDFIHAARLRDGNVLIHCLAGMSRSVTVAVAYIMSVTNLSWKEALKVVRTGRAVANPNIGFQTQLQEFEIFRLAEERRRLKERFPSNTLEQSDCSKCSTALDNYEELLQNKGICEGNCSRGQVCPTGVCTMDMNKKGLLRRRPSSASTRSRLHMQPSSSASTTSLNTDTRRSNTVQSCPATPHCSPLPQRFAGAVEKRLLKESSSSEIMLMQTCETVEQDEEEEQGDAIKSNQTGTSAKIKKIIKQNLQHNDKQQNELQHCATSSIGARPRTAPAGLFSYTGSVPSSVRNSRIDLGDDKGSAIYLGCSAPRNSTISLSSRGSSNGSNLSSPARTPPVSPGRNLKKSTSERKKPR